MDNCKEYAIATSPYSPTSPEQLRLITGDRLEVISKTEQFAKCRCIDTLEEGEVPIELISISTKINENKFDLVGLEVQCLFRYLFVTYFKTQRLSEKDVVILDDIKKIQSLLPLTENNKVQIGIIIDEIRTIIGWNKMLRNSNGDHISVHNLDYSAFGDKAQDKANQKNLIYSPQLEITTEFTYNFNCDLKLGFRLIGINKDDKRHEVALISAPCDVFLNSGYNEKKIINFVNIDRSSFSSIALLCRVFTIDKSSETQSYLYKGVGVDVVNLPDNLFNDNVNLTIPFYTANEIPQADVTDLILNSILNSIPNDKNLIRVDDLPPLNINLDFKESPTESKNCTKSNIISTIKFPINISTASKFNSLFVKIGLLHHKTKLKKTRIVLRVLDTEKGDYVKCFKGTANPIEFPTVIQKGFVEMKIDEIAEIDLNESSNLKNWVMIFEVQRTNSKGITHLSSFATYSIISNDEVIHVNDKLTLTLNKPPTQIMTKESYLNALNNKSKLGTGGDINISISLVSTEFTASPLLHKMFNWKNYIEELKNCNESPQNIDETTIAIFLYRIFLSLAEMMNSSNLELQKFATDFFVKTLSQIDQSRYYVLKALFDSFIETQFTEKQTELAKIYSHLMEYIADALPSEDNQKVGENLKKCQDCCRSLSYILSVISASLNSNKEIKNEESLKNAVKTVFQKLGFLIKAKDNSFDISKSFVCRVFPILCDVVLNYFQQDEKINLIINFLNSFDLTVGSQMISKKINVILGITETKFFSEESNRKMILPHIIDSLDELKENIFPIILSMFFASKFHNDFKITVKYLLKYINEIIQTKTNNNFAITLLYYSEPSSIMEYIKNSKNIHGTYTTLLNFVLTVVKSSPPPYIFYICTSIFNELVSISQSSSYLGLNESYIDKLIDTISKFFSEFMKTITQFNECDRNFFKHIYITDLSQISGFLPKLLKSMGDGSFSDSVFLPLFHFYLNQKDLQTRASVVDSFILILEKDINSSANPLARSENACIRAIDAISNSESSFLELKTLFKDAQNKLAYDAKAFFENLNIFAQSMYDLGVYPNQRQYEDERTTGIISLLNTCISNKDFQLYPHFAAKLYELHISFGNKTEAAEALVECSKILSWDDKSIISEECGFPDQPKYERKRLILHKAVDLFMETFFYERALEVLDELYSYYKNILEDSYNISNICSLQYQCYDNICNQERNILNRFYGVKYYGKKFDIYFRDKTFVYRRDGFFMNDQMMRDLKDKFPNAKVDPKPPSEEELQNPNIFYIHVFNLKPRDLPVFDSYEPPSERMVKSVCNITEFYSETPERIRRPGNYGEFAEWHRNIVKFFIKRPLQSYVRREPIIESMTEKYQMSPIECAVFDTNAKTIELMQKACMYWRCIRYKLSYNTTAVSSFSMLASGIVNAAVNGGTKVFQELFLESDLKNEEINVKFSQKLKDAFADQLKAVNFALKVHNIVKSKQYADLHQNIVENFEEMKKQMEKSIGVVDLDSPPVSFVIPSMDFFNLK